MNLKTLMYVLLPLAHVTASLIRLDSQRMQLPKLGKEKLQIWRRPRRYVVLRTSFHRLRLWTQVKEKEEKRAAREEREKKQKETQDKSRSLMANFFGKAKAPPRQSPSKAGNLICGTSNSESEFQKTFKPFVVKKDAEMAPINWFLKSRKGPSGKQRSGLSHAQAIIIDIDRPSSAADVSLRSLPSFNLTEATAQGAYIEALWSMSLILFSRAARGYRAIVTALSTLTAP